MYHTCLDIEGALKWSKRQLKGMLKNSITGRVLTADEVRQYLIDRLKEGKSVIPMCECDNFDYKKGCQGHPIPDQEDGQHGKG